jgi:protein DJ-1
MAKSRTVIAVVHVLMGGSGGGPPPAGRWLAAICAATTVLVESSAHFATVVPAEYPYVPPKRRVTSHPSVKKQIVEAGWEYAGQDERVVVDGNVITSRGPGTALAWALAIVEEVAGFEKRMEVQGPMMVATVL